MIYKFKSQADADVIMLQANGDQMLSIIGKEPSARGIIIVAQMPAAIAALDDHVFLAESFHLNRRGVEHTALSLLGNPVIR